MPEVQKPVLEHAETETQEKVMPQSADGTQAGIKLVNYKLITNRDLNDPDVFRSMDITLPNNTKARFIRATAWEAT